MLGVSARYGLAEPERNMKDEKNDRSASEALKMESNLLRVRGSPCQDLNEECGHQTESKCVWVHRCMLIFASKERVQ